MTYDIVILVIGGLAAFGAIRAAIDMSRNRFYVVGLGHPDGKDDKHSEEKLTPSDPAGMLMPSEEISESAKPALGTFDLGPGMLSEARARLDSPVMDGLLVAVKNDKILNYTPEVVRCKQCLLVQSRTVSDLCRRCSHPLPSSRFDLKVGQIRQKAQRSEHRESTEQTKVMEHHGRRLDELEERIKQIERQSSREWEVSQKSRSTTTLSGTVQ